ncbi:MAG: 30S ribosomal protein S1 [Candidatus Marinimicrobia bacterium]|nr:30S ribosomal protein S1 [Candidatus Neomarinimicrobiota bacterium]
MAANFEKLLDESLSTVIMKPGSLVTGIVLDILDNYVVIHVGLKSEAAVAISEFNNESGELDIEIGDEVQLTLEAIEDGHGNTRVSREKAIKQEVWKRIEDCLNNDHVLKGLITGSVKGGMTVDVQGIKAFLPGSLAEVLPTKDLEYLVGNYEEFKVIKLDKEKNNVVLSRKAVLQEVNSEEREKLLSTLTEGQTIKGVVKNLTDYGAFVDLGGIDGLLHITDISWSRINHPSEAIKIGEKLDVKVIKYDEEEKKVSLGIKQLVDDPWVGIESKFPLNTSVMAKVTNLTDYGFFAEIEEGVEGLVHVSEIDWTNKNIHPSKVVQLKDQVEVMILEVDEDKRRISLGLKQLTENPWQVFAHTHKEGDKVKGAIKSITDFGVFIELDGGIDGLVHLSDISWDEDESKLRTLSKDSIVEAMVLSIEAERERISLGMKQLSSDSFGDYVEQNTKGSRVYAKVIEFNEQKINLELAEGVTGSLPQKDFINSNSEIVLEEGLEMEVVVANINQKEREIILSLRALEKQEEKSALKDNAKKNKEIEEASKSNIGDLIKAEMEDTDSSDE